MDDFEFPDAIGQDMSEYEGDLTPSEGDFSDVFDPGDEIFQFEEDEEPREDSGCP